MMIGTREVIHETCLPFQDIRQIGECASADRAGYKQSLAGWASNRREEARIEARQICTYELCESIDEEAVVIQQGEVFTLNRSAHGILLIMGEAPRPKQLLELHIPESWWRHSINLFEAQWSKSFHVESQGDLFLVGCRLTFDPPRY